MQKEFHYQLLYNLIISTSISSQEIHQNPGSITSSISSFENRNRKKGLGGLANRELKEIFLKSLDS